MINWAAVEKEFIPDGSLLDLCVYDTDLEDWQLFLEMLRQMKVQAQYIQDGKAAEFSWSARQLFNDRDHAHDFSF